MIHNENGTVVPLIIASDETTLTNNPKGPKAHPVYLSIGNISKATRRKPSKRAMILLGYLPVGDFVGLPDKVRQQYHAELLHRSLEKVFEPLKTALSDRLLAWCADGSLWRIYPIIVAWIADWPEQNDIACTTQSGCPKCTHKRKGRGQGRASAPLRDQDATLEALREYERTKQPAVLKKLLLRPVKPFWADIPYVDIGGCLAPDLLHQFYKGMFEHARDWTEELLGMEEFNRRFKSMPRAPDLRYFKKGVTTVKIWRGRESREMMRQFLPVVLDAQVPRDFVRMMRALLDFSYLAHGAQLTDVELTEMDSALAAFHKAKHALVDMNIYQEHSAFDRIAKLHMLGHYPGDIRELGVPDGFSTETPEHLHIVYVKIPWRMSNRREPLPQMVGYVRRIKAMEIQRTIIEEVYGERKEVEVDKTDIYADEDDEAEGGAGEGNVGGSKSGEVKKVDEDDEDGEDGEDDEDEGELKEVQSDERGEPDRSEIYYPRPLRFLAKQPTVPRVPGHVLITSYHAADLIRALQRFLLPKVESRGEDLIILPSDRFHVWHKVTLRHPLLPFSPTQSCHRDVIRAHPVLRDAAGRVKTPGVFDTALFAVDRDAIGLPRYRAGRVRAMFSLPPHLQHLYPRPLAYLELFTSFVPDPTTRCLYRTAHAYHDGCRASMIVPVACLAMACYLAPDFTSPSTPGGRFDVSSPTYTGPLGYGTTELI
ncbi:hypothetical protein FRC08_003339 [Ceratobasidium sp. 394]|nr:hypothetical protein FRC08_003339 [Ceratobasidium sp. 394]